MYKYCTNVLQILYNCWVVTARQLSLLRIHLSPKYIQLARSTKPINNSKYIQYIYCNCNCELWKLISAVIWIKFNQRETQFHDYSNMDLGLKVWTCHYWMKTCFNCHHLFCFRPIKTGVQLQTHKNVWSMYRFAKLDHISKSESTFILSTAIMSTMRNIQLQLLQPEKCNEMGKLGRTCQVCSNG